MISCKQANKQANEFLKEKLTLDYDRILKTISSEIKEESENGRFESSYHFQSNEKLTMEKIVKELRANGFAVKIVPMITPLLPESSTIVIKWDQVERGPYE